MYEIVLKMYEMMLLASVDKETESAKRHDGDSCGATTDGLPVLVLRCLYNPCSHGLTHDIKKK